MQNLGTIHHIHDAQFYMVETCCKRGFGGELVMVLGYVHLGILGCLPWIISSLLPPDVSCMKLLKWSILFTMVNGEWIY